MEEQKLSRGKRFLAVVVAVLLVLFIVAIVGEFMVRFIKPQHSMYPRWQFSAEYGAMLFPDRSMVHERPGHWRFLYTTNANRCRGELVPVSDSYERENVVVMGDSYSFGMGVDDEDVYAAVLSMELGDSHDVVNLAVGGWGLTQQIRRYYELGQLYEPCAAVLQFCSNDPRDNFKNRVTEIEDGRFVFKDSAFRLNSLKRFLSDSIIQKSQLYNLLRNPLYLRYARPTIEESMRSADGGGIGEVPRAQRFHNELLELFARELSEEGVALILISVDGHLESFPFIEAKIAELESLGLLTYCEVEDWFGGRPHPCSPEGHAWGREAHRMIGEGLAEVISELK